MYEYSSRKCNTYFLLYGCCCGNTMTLLRLCVFFTWGIDKTCQAKDAYKSRGRQRRHCCCCRLHVTEQQPSQHHHQSHGHCSYLVVVVHQLQHCQLSTGRLCIRLQWRCSGCTSYAYMGMTILGVHRRSHISYSSLLLFGTTAVVRCCNPIPLSYLPCWSPREEDTEAHRHHRGHTYRHPEHHATYLPSSATSKTAHTKAGYSSSQQCELCASAVAGSAAVQGAGLLCLSFFREFREKSSRGRVDISAACPILPIAHCPLWPIAHIVHCTKPKAPPGNSTAVYRS